MQRVAMDGTSSPADSGLVLLGKAIKRELGTRSQRWLADRIGVDPSVMTRIINGQMKDLTVDRVAAIEDALDVPRGSLLRAAGYVAPTVSAEDAIRQDPSLPRQIRQALVDVVEANRRRASDVSNDGHRGS